MTDEVILIFTDRHSEKWTAARAEEICRDRRISGYIMDALTEDRDLQTRLRKIIDGDLQY